MDKRRRCARIDLKTIDVCGFDQRANWAAKVRNVSSVGSHRHGSGLARASRTSSTAEGVPHGLGLPALCLATAATSEKRPLIARVRISSACYTSHEGDAGLERSAVAETGYRRSVCLFPGHAPAGMALSRSRAPAAFSPDPIRRCFAPARRKREVELRHAVLQAVEGLLLPEIGQERAPGRSRLDRLVPVSRRLRTTPCGVRNRGGESGSGAGRGQADHPRFACQNSGRSTM